MDKNNSIAVAHLIVRGRHYQAIVKAQQKQNRCYYCKSATPAICKEIDPGWRTKAVEPYPFFSGSWWRGFISRHIKDIGTDQEYGGTSIRALFYCIIAIDKNKHDQFRLIRIAAALANGQRASENKEKAPSN